MELAVTGPSYRHASKTLEKLLGYSVASHEAIRQHLLQTEVIPSQPILYQKKFSLSRQMVCILNVKVRKEKAKKKNRSDS